MQRWDGADFASFCGFSMLKFWNSLQVFENLDIVVCQVPKLHPRPVYPGYSSVNPGIQFDRVDNFIDRNTDIQSSIIKSCFHG